MISIVTVSYNSDATIARTFDSILNQSYEGNIEYIVIDGASTDGTIQTIQKYKQIFKEREISFSWISEPDEGIYDAMNKGIRKTSGDILGILNSDDFYEPDALQNVYNSAICYPSIDVFYGFLRILMPNGDELQVYRYCYENYLTKMGAGCESAAQHPTCFVRRSLYDRIGLFDLDYKTAADYEFLVRARLNGANFLGLDAIISNFSDGGASSKVMEYDRTEQRNRTHYTHGLIPEKVYAAALKRLKYTRYKALKAKIVNTLWGSGK